MVSDLLRKYPWTLIPLIRFIHFFVLPISTVLPKLCTKTAMYIIFDKIKFIGTGTTSSPSYEDGS